MRTKKEALYAGIKSFVAKNCGYVVITDDLLDELVEISNGTGDMVKAGVEHLLDAFSTESVYELSYPGGDNHVWQHMRDMDLLRYVRKTQVLRRKPAEQIIAMIWANNAGL